MKAKIVRRLIWCALTPSFFLYVPTVFAAKAKTADGPMKCLQYFSGDMVLGPVLNQTTSTALVHAEVIPTWREIVEIRDGDKQYPPTTRFGSEYVNKYHYYQDALGDQMKVEIYPDAHPLSKNNTYAQIGAQTEKQRQVDLILNSRKPAPLAGKDLATTNVNPANDYEAARIYALNQFAQKPDEQSLAYVVQTVLKSPELLAQARSSYSGFVNSRKVELTNFGLNRYFWFTPEGGHEAVAARVLDIHRDVNPQGFVFLAEYMSENSQGGVRTRKVVQLREGELKSIHAEIAHQKDRLTAQEIFFDSLSPDEIQSLKLAKSLNLKLFGYFDITRRPGQERPSVETPLQAMNSITHLAISKHITDTFGSINDLLTPAELNLPFANFMDVFSRLNPKYVMQRFGGAKAMNSEFYWVITEDGQLKVMPAMNKGNNLKPQILRFAGGRKIFAGGTFHLKADGTLDVAMNANGFQQADMAWGNYDAYQTNNKNVNEFVKIIFGLQMGQKISKLNSEPVERWYTNQNARYTGTHRDQDYAQGHDSYAGGADYFTGMKSQAQKATAGKMETLSWDMEKGNPMSLSDYAAKMQTSDRDQATKLEWAHYVLQTHSKMAFGDIKKVYRTLAMKFHPDRNKDNIRAEKISQEVTWAYRIMEEILK